MTSQAETLRTALAGRYTLGPEIGAGGMGTVFLAVDEKHHRDVAIKVLRPEVAVSLGGDRFLREIEIAAGLVHPHIVPVFDSGEAAGALYYVMPRVEGSTVKELLRRREPLPVEQALAIARDVADGLAYAHDAGFVHRDIKPDNILVAGGHGLIVDFGIARAVAVAASESLTMTGIALGTPMYMSPEQFAQGADVDARSDIYSLGCVLYGMLVGHPPFEGRTPAALMASHVGDVVPDLADVSGGLPPPVVSIVRRMLAKDPNDRFPSAAEARDALEEALRGGRSTSLPSPPVRPWPERLRAAAALAALFGALAVASALLDRRGAPLSIQGDGASVVVLPFRDEASTSEERTMLVDVAGEVTRQLNRWESMRAVPGVALSGILFDLSVPGPTLERIDDGLEIAAQSGAGTLVALTGRLRGDTAVVVASQFDVPNRRSVGRSMESVGPEADRFAIAARLVHGIMGLEGSIEEVEELRRQSASPEALARQADGKRALDAWRLQEASTSFRAAIEADSTFAMAHHYLALTLYWQLARDASLTTALAPEIARESFSALRNARGLPVGDSTHIQAFFSFQEGDYEAARDGYERLLARDRTDVYALLLRGIVEYHDPWLAERSDGTLTPRQDLNVALSSFAETVRLSPAFHLGYGHLFDITARVLAAADNRTGIGFDKPRNERIAPWDRVTPFDQLAFLAVSLDTLAWLPRDAFDALSESDVRDGADRLLRSSMRTLRRWSAFAPNEPRPLDELVEWTLRERSRLPPPVPPQRLDSLLAVAEGLAERAFQARGDTLPTELLRLGNLRLARGDPQGATVLLEDFQQMLAQQPEPQRQPASSTNVPLYTGQPSRAVQLLARGSERRVYFVVGDGEELVDDRGADRTLQTLRMLAATDVSGPRLEEAFQRLDSLWSPTAYTPEQSATIRSRIAPTLAAALALVPGRAASWLADAERDDPIWEIVRSTTVDASEGERLLQAVADYDGEQEVGGAARAYIVGRFAQRVGRHEEAIRHLSRLDSVPLSVRNRDVGWGHLSLSYFHRAESYEALGDTATALPLYRRFLEAWDQADDWVPPWRIRALEAVGRAPQ